MKSDLVRRETAGVELFLLMLMFLLVLEPLTLPVANAQALTWTPVTSPVRNTLDSVYCASASDCWAVGLFPCRIIQWNSASWDALQPLPSSIGSAGLFSVFCVSAYDCWAVGGLGTIIQFNGAAWTTVTSPTYEGLLSVFCVSTSDCWAVGYDGTIIQWTGSSWKTVTSPTNNTLQSVYCIGAGDCWAVGGVGTIIQFGGSAWTSVTSPTSNTLHSAFCVSASDCWAVGFNGTILHYSPEY